MSEPFLGFDFTNFWRNIEYYDTEYTDDPLTQEKIALVESKLGYKLPQSYIALMTTRNGGAPINNCHRTSTRTSWSADHVAMTGFLSIGNTKRFSLCGAFGSDFMIEEWGYPAIGVYFADCPSGGHDMLCLDYSACGPSGEPRIVHVDQEIDYAITHVAGSFESFVRGLVASEMFDSERRAVH
jgi:hypothetical protein